jgi:hypothetical protein
MKKIAVLLMIFALSGCWTLQAQHLLVFMDGEQTDHLRAYGVAYWTLQNGLKAEWLLNYRGGSFLLEDAGPVREYASLQGVSYEPVDAGALSAIYAQIDKENMNRIFLDKAPKIAVYAPPTNDPWDDAVTLVLEYANIPYDKLWDKEVMTGRLSKYDWLHLHHEDFSGQYGKFYGSYRDAEWYQAQVAKNRQMASELGFSSVQEEKGAVAKMIQASVADGGFLFAMCAACDTLDIALAAEGLNIVPPEIGGGIPLTPDGQDKLDFSRTFAFQNFKLIMNPYVYGFSDIDTNPMAEGIYDKMVPFHLFDFSAKEDPVACMLNQDHTFIVDDFLGQTTAFHDWTIKPSVTVLGSTPETHRIKYIHGDFGKGTFTFLGGHDPEDYKQLVGDAPTDLSLHKNSPGYRLILNNVLFPAARKEKRKT